MSTPLPERLKEMRVKAGLTQQELGEKLGLGKSTISEWESGKRMPGLELVEDIAKALGIDPWYLMGWSTEPSLDSPYENDQTEPTEAQLARYGGDKHAYRVSKKHLTEEFGGAVYDVYPDEYQLLLNYRALDDYGKDLLNTVAAAEFRRVRGTKK